MHQDKPLIQEYISRAITTEYRLLDSCLNQLSDIPSQEIKIQIEEEEVETSAFGILYSISLLSFLQGRPAGASLIDYREQDVWSVEDFHRHQANLESDDSAPSWSRPKRSIPNWNFAMILHPFFACHPGFSIKDAHPLS